MFQRLRKMPYDIRKWIFLVEGFPLYYVLTLPKTLLRLKPKSFQFLRVWDSFSTNFYENLFSTKQFGSSAKGKYSGNVKDGTLSNELDSSNNVSY